MSRNDFNETWLIEMPMVVDALDAYPILLNNINDFKNYNIQPIKIKNNLYKINHDKLFLYWFETNNNIDIAVELYKKPQGLVVDLVGRRTDYKGPPFTTDLYNEILNDTHKSIRIMSDTQLSLDGVKLWQRLYQNGNKISVYDKENPGKSFITIDNINDFDDFLSRKQEYMRYQFILSEHSVVLAETKCFFNTRRYRELSGLSLNNP